MLFEALASGGGSDWYYTILMKAPLGSDITINDGDEEVTAVGAGDTIIGIPVHNPSSTYNISVVASGFTKTSSAATPATSGGISSLIEVQFGEIDLTFDDEFRGLSATIANEAGTKTSTVTLPATGNTDTLFVPDLGKWIISSTVSGDTFTAEATIGSYSVPETAELAVIPNGKTVLPVNSIEKWLLCGNIKDKNYTTLAEVLADEDTLRKLLTDDNAIDYMVRSKNWSKTKNNIPVMTSDTAPYGTCIRSSVYDSSDKYQAYKTFNDNIVWSTSDYGWNPLRGESNSWIGYKYDEPMSLISMDLWMHAYGAPNSGSVSFKVQGSADGSTNWEDVTDTITITGLNTAASNVISGPYHYDINCQNEHLAYRLLFDGVIEPTGNSYAVPMEIKFYQETGIIDDETAMSYIGAYDYAAETLLSDATWKSAIFDSAYKEDVLNAKVPQMTSDTEPYGKVTKISDISTYLSWYAFNDSQSNGWIAYSSPNHRQGDWIAYEFTIPNKLQIAEVGIVWRNTCSVTGKIQGYDEDLGQWEDVSNNSLITAYSDSRKTKIDINTNGKTYKKYQFICTSTATSTNEGGLKIQFYGREAGGVQTLLKAAGISKPYTTIEELLADHVTLQKVISSHDAIDYLVTAKSFIDEFTSDATAMRLIGKRNYASYTLLADADWNNGIVESEYRASVLPNTVPTMTGPTTPEGVASGSSTYSDYYPWKAFNPNQAHGWHSTDDGLDKYIQYEFVNACKVRNVRLEIIPDTTHVTHTSVVKLLGSNDNFVSDIHELQTLCSGWDDLYLKDGRYFPITNSVDLYKYYRVLFENENNYNYDAGLKVQFYGRTDVDETNIDIYSAALDNVTYDDPTTGSPVAIDQTDATGKLTVSRNDLPNGEYTLRSSVAKNPNDLSNFYFKRVKIDADTIEVEFMPEDVLYWYGYKGNVEHCETANGWTPLTSGYPFISVTWNTQNVTSYTASAGFSWVGSKKAVKTKKVNLIYKGITYQENSCGEIELWDGKNISSSGTRYINKPLNAPQNQLTKTTASQNVADECYIVAGSSAAGYGRSAEMHAIFADPADKTPTFLSAAYDILYILDGARQIPIAITNGEGKSFDLMLVPGTYDIYSSVAKDPNNLSLPYHKQVTITAATQTVKIMPDGALYWYGYRDDNFEVGSVANGWTVESGYSFIDPTFEDNYVDMSCSSGKEIIVGSKNIINNLTRTKALIEGVTASSSEYGIMLNNSAKSAGGTASSRVTVTTATKQYFITTPDISDDAYAMIYVINARRLKLYTLLCE